MNNSIRHKYEQCGYKQYYIKYGNTYQNPHESAIQELLPKCLPPFPGHALDLACGSGEASLVMMKHGWKVTGIDPYTTQAYVRRTGQIAGSLSFEDIINGKLNIKFDLIVCSYAMHLLERSKLPYLIYQLYRITSKLIIITPNNRPILKPEWGFRLIQSCKCSKAKAMIYAHND